MLGANKMLIEAIDPEIWLVEESIVCGNLKEFELMHAPAAISIERLLKEKWEMEIIDGKCDKIVVVLLGQFCMLHAGILKNF